MNSPLIKKIRLRNTRVNFTHDHQLKSKINRAETSQAARINWWFTPWGSGTGISKGRDFTCQSTWRCKGGRYFDWWKVLKRLTDVFYGCERVEQTFCQHWYITGWGVGLRFGVSLYETSFLTPPPPPRVIRVLDLNELGLSIFAKKVI